jgi:HK97 family phage major capsid protein
VRGPEQRTVDVDVEGLDTRGRTIHGYASVYGVLSHDLGGFRETIARGAFADVLGTDVRCLLNHDASQVLARSKSGTLRLFDEERGLRFEADLPDSPLGENVRAAVGRGDIDGASFRFKVAADEWAGEVRTIVRVGELHDVTVATYNAYPDASVELRTRPENPTPAEREEETTMKPEDRTGPGGGLAVEDRAASPGPTLEQRVVEALGDVRKGENRALTTAAAISPTEVATYLLDKLRPASVGLASGMRVIPTDRDSLAIPALTTDVAPAFYAELDTITAGDPVFATLTATPRKIAHRVELSNEVIDDSEPSVVEVLNEHLTKVLALKLDSGIFEGSGAAPAIRGLKNVAGIGAVSMGANGSALVNLDPFADALALLEAANAPGPYVFVMAPRTFAALRKLKETTTSIAPVLVDPPTEALTPSLFGARIYVSGQLATNETQGTATTASSIYCYAPSEVVVVTRKDAEIELDRSRMFHMDATEMRGTLRADLLVPNVGAVARIAGVLP